MSAPVDVSDRETVNVRVLNAPRERVFEAWTEPALLARWWGPKGFRNTFQEFDPKPGGVWRFVMHGPNGVDYQNKSVFLEIAFAERIVFRHLEPMHEFQVTAAFAERDGKTELTFRMLFDTAEECDRVKKFVIEANEQNLDRLEALLTEPATKEKGVTHG